MNKNVIEPITAEGMGTDTQESDITMTEPVYTFRKLNSTDTFLMFRIISKIGINDFIESFDENTLKSLFALTKGGAETMTVAGLSLTLEVVKVVINNLPKCEAEIYEMLSNTSNLTVEQVKELDFATFTEMVIDFVKKDEFKANAKVDSKAADDDKPAPRGTSPANAVSKPSTLKPRF